MSTSTSKPQRSRLRRYFLFGGLPALAALGLFFAPRAHAFGPFHGRHGHRPPASAAEVREHMLRRVDHLLDKVDASDEQRDKVEAIVERTAPRLFEIFEGGRKVRKELKQALLAATVDKARVAKVQQDIDALANQASELGLGALTEIAEVLTPAQRKSVADELARFHR